jgi:hypothetical protein
MSGTRLDWLSFGLAKSLKHTLRQLIWWCNNFARSKGLQPCRAGYFQPDSFLNARVIMSDRSRAKEFVSADTAIVSCKLLRGILRPLSYASLEHWALPGQREWSRPKQRRDWGIMTLAVDMRPIATPHTDLCGMATASVRVSLIYIGIVVVVRHVNLWCNYTTVLICSKQSVRYVGSCPDYRTIRVWDVQVEVMTWYMISCKCGLILISSVSINAALACTR